MDSKVTGRKYESVKYLVAVVSLVAVVAVVAVGAVVHNPRESVSRRDPFGKIPAGRQARRLIPTSAKGCAWAGAFY